MHARADVGDACRVLLGDGVADGVGDVERGGSGVDGDLEHLAHEVEVGPGRVLGGELDVVGVRLAWATERTASIFTWSGVIRSLFFMWISLVAMKMWMRARSASWIASQQRSTSFERGARQPADHRAAHRPGDGLDAPRSRPGSRSGSRPR